MARSLDGLVLSPVADQAPGQVGTRTRFTYHEEKGTIWADYAGGGVVRGISSAPAPAIDSTSGTSS